MEKNILTCVGEERRGRKETKNSLAQVLERIWDIGNGWSWERRWGISVAGGLPSYSQPASVRRGCPWTHTYLIGHRGWVHSIWSGRGGKDGEGSDFSPLPTPTLWRASALLEVCLRFKVKPRQSQSEKLHPFGACSLLVEDDM